MCGIAGILNQDGRGVDGDGLRSMVASLSHRGPDDEGLYTDGSLGLVHRRLSIFDLSPMGAQPMESRDGRYVIVHNGEVYNWKEVRLGLRFDRWKSQTDTETILYAFIEHGEKCLQLFNGMFAFGIWDRTERRLFLARDRVGIKPLFYGIQDGRFYFASEIKALFAGGFAREVNPAAIYDFLRWGAIDHHPQTFFKNIRSVEPGHCLTVGTDLAIRERCYWSLPEAVQDAGQRDEPDIIEEYIGLLQDSIRLRLRSDVEVGLFLSGGVDSSILAARMAAENPASLPRSFTYEFASSGEGEGAYAEEVARHLGLNNTVVALSEREIPDYFTKAIYHQEQPVTSIRCLASQKLYEQVRVSSLKVILEGHGGDQLGGGFEYYFLPAVLDTAAQQGPTAAIELLDRFMQLYGVSEDARYRKLSNALLAAKYPGIATQDGISFVKPELLHPDFIESFDRKRVAYGRPFVEELLNAQYIDFRHHNLPRVLRYTDRESMASGVEARVPLLDHRIVELCFSSTLKARVKDGQQRYFMRRAAERLLPEEMLNRPKRSIVDPQRQWLQRDLRPWIEDLFRSASFAGRGIFDVPKVIAEYERYCADPQPVTGFHIFQYVNIEMWFRTMVDNLSEKVVCTQ